MLYYERLRPLPVTLGRHAEGVRTADPYNDREDMKLCVEGGEIPFQHEVAPLSILRDQIREKELHPIIVLPAYGPEGTRFDEPPKKPRRLRRNGLEETEQGYRLRRSNIEDTIRAVSPALEHGLARDILVVTNHAPGVDDDVYETAARMGVSAWQAEDELARLGLDNAAGKGVNLWLSNIYAMERAQELGIDPQKLLLVYCDTDFLSGELRGSGSRRKPYTVEDQSDRGLALMQGILSPLVMEDDAILSLPIFQRVTKGGNPAGADQQGGRVTKLSFRQAVGQYLEEASGLISPIAGLYAVRPAAFVESPIPNRYGVETAYVMDGLVKQRSGEGTVRQVYCGTKSQVGQGYGGLSDMSAQIVTTAAERAQMHQLQRQPVSHMVDYAFGKNQEGRVTVTPVVRRVDNGVMPAPSALLRTQVDA